MDIQFIRAEDERAYPYLEAGFWSLVCL
jgi:hypothetical protein